MTTGRINQVSRLGLKSQAKRREAQSQNPQTRTEISQHCNGTGATRQQTDFPTSVYLNSGKATRPNRTENKAHQDTNTSLDWADRTLETRSYPSLFQRQQSKRKDTGDRQPIRTRQAHCTHHTLQHCTTQLAPASPTLLRFTTLFPPHIDLDRKNIKYDICFRVIIKHV